MDDAVVMRIVEGVGDLDQDRHHPVETVAVDWLGALFLRRIENLTKRIALDELHRKVVVAAVVTR